jgi:hypothetical protein
MRQLKLPFWKILDIKSSIIPEVINLFLGGNKVKANRTDLQQLGDI